MGWFSKRASSRVALLAGQGDFPALFVEAAAAEGLKIFVIGIEGITDKRIDAHADAVYYLGWGQVERFISLLKDNGIREIVFAGGIPKKDLHSAGPAIDPIGKAMIDSVPNKGDDHFMRAVGIFLRLKCGVSVADPRKYIRPMLAHGGVMTKCQPGDGEWSDLKFGLKIARGIGRLDIGQTVVVKNGVVLAVEAVEGTDQAIRRGGQLANKGAVAVKAAKPIQDLRFDLPCIGPDTIESLCAVSAAALGVEAKKTVMLHKKKLLEKAEAAGLSIVGL